MHEAAPQAAKRTKGSTMLSSRMPRLGRLLLALTVLAVAGGLIAAPAKAYSHNDPTVECTNHFDISGRLIGRSIFPSTPAMFSGDYFTNVPIAYQPILHVWTGSYWKIEAYGTTVSGWTSNMPASTGFNIHIPKGYYRVSIKYGYYWNNALAASEWTWASTHTTWNQIDGTYDFSQTGAGDWCYFGGTATGAHGKGKAQRPKLRTGSPSKLSRPGQR
jgi:hypothetical protein